MILIVGKTNPWKWKHDVENWSLTWTKLLVKKLYERRTFVASMQCAMYWIILYICLQSFMFTNFHVMASIVFSAAWFVSALWHLSVINTTLNFSFFFYSPLQRNQTVRPPTAVEMRGRERRPEIGRGRASVGPAAESQPRSTAGLCGISDLCSVLSGAADNLHVELGTRKSLNWSNFERSLLFFLNFLCLFKKVYHETVFAFSNIFLISSLTCDEKKKHWLKLWLL